MKKRLRITVCGVSFFMYLHKKLNSIFENY